MTVIYLGGYHTEAGLIVRQAKEQGLKATLIGGDALVTNEFWQIAGDAGTGTMMTLPPDPRLMKSAADAVKEFKAKKIDPEGYVLYTYAAIQVWADAVKKIGSIRRAGDRTTRPFSSGAESIRLRRFPDRTTRN